MQIKHWLFFRILVCSLFFRIQFYSDPGKEVGYRILGKSVPDSKSGPFCGSFLRKEEVLAYLGTSLRRNHPPLGPYSRTMPRALWCGFS